MSVITVLNASKTYGNEDELKVEALKPTSFSVEKGEFVCIIGTSGSGKSTLLHLLAGVDTATTGQIIINGNYKIRPRIISGIQKKRSRDYLPILQLSTSSNSKRKYRITTNVR